MALEKLKSNELLSITRRSINKTLVSVRLESFKLLKKNVKTTTKKLKDKYTETEKATGNTVDALQGSFTFNTKSMPLIDFVSGNKDPIKQKGIPVAKRRRLKVMVRPGSRVQLKQAFIQRANNSIQVFRRVDNKLKRLTAPSTAHIVNSSSDNIKYQIQKYGTERFSTILTRELNAQINKLY